MIFISRNQEEQQFLLNKKDSNKINKKLYLNLLIILLYANQG